MPVFNKMVYNGTEYILWWWGNIWEPLNLHVTPAWLDATITWEDNEIWTIPPTSFAKSELVRKQGSAPTSPSDWTLLVTETVKDSYKTTGYSDQWLTDWETYYYVVFSYSDSGGISYCEPVSYTATTRWQPWANTKFYYNINDNDTTSTIYDLSGNWVDMTWYGNPSFSTDVTYGRVAEFDWSSYTQANNRVNLWSECTMIALVNRSSWDAVVIECTSPSAWGVWIAYSWDVNKYAWWYWWAWASDPKEIRSLTNYVSNQRVMIATTRDSSWTARIYVNWVLDNTLSWMNNPNYSSWEALQLGRWRYGWPQYITWKIKLVIWEDRCWTDAEIASLAGEYGF